MSQAVTLNLPDEIYRVFKEKAERTRRSVEAELVEALTSVAPESSEQAEDLIASLSKLDEAALWRAARSHLPTRAVSRMEGLHHKRQLEGLDEDEAKTLQNLLQQYDRYMLIRAKAAELLHQRGYDVSVLLKKKA